MLVTLGIKSACLGRPAVISAIIFFQGSESLSLLQKAFPCVHLKYKNRLGKKNNISACGCAPLTISNPFSRDLFVGSLLIIYLGTWWLPPTLSAPSTFKGHRVAVLSNVLSPINNPTFTAAAVKQILQCNIHVILYQFGEWIGRGLKTYDIFVIFKKIILNDG